MTTPLCWKENIERLHIAKIRKIADASAKYSVLFWAMCVKSKPRVAS